MFGGVGSFVLAYKNLLGNLFSVFLFLCVVEGCTIQRGADDEPF